MNTLILRIALLILHVFINVVAAAYLTRLDLSGSWVTMAGLVLALLLLLGSMIIHLLSFIKFYKHH